MKNQISDPLPANSCLTLDTSKLTAFGFQNVHAEVVEGKVQIYYNQPRLVAELFDVDVLKAIDTLIGEEDTENLVIKARRMFERGVLLSLLSK